ncbi:MAG: hypothetical protein ACFFEV_09525 [Candidatus Thorarchaeota archaeon]
MSLAQFILIQFYFDTMSLSEDRTGSMCLCFMFGGVCVFMGFMFFFTLRITIPIFEIVSQILIYGGIILMVAGFAFRPSIKKNHAIRKSIVDIAKVRKEVTFSEISQETGIDRELVEEVITEYIRRRWLFGYIEGDLFVRDTGARPRTAASSERMGMGSIFDD